MPLRIQLAGDIGTPASWDEAERASTHEPAMREAVAYFRVSLGERWRGWADKSHLARVFHLSVQSQEREWVRLHRLLNALNGVENLDLLIADLSSPAWHRHIAAEQTLEFCGRMRGAGRRVEIIKPSQKTAPDVRVWLHDRPVTIEFKALHDSDEQAAWDSFTDELHHELFRRRPGTEVFPFDIEFFDPAREHVEAIADALTLIAARGEDGIHDLPHGTGRATYLGAPALPRALRYPIAQRDDLDRIVANLGGTYRRQLRGLQDPTLLVVLTQRMFFVQSEQMPVVAREAATALQAVLVERATVSALLIHEEPLEPPARPMLHVSNGWRFATTATEGRARTSLLIQNAGANIAMLPRELDALIGTNMCW